MKKSFTLIELLYCVVIVALVIFLLAEIFGGFFVNENDAVKALEDAGYSDVTITNRAVFFMSFRGGSRSDSVRFTATAMNPIGKKVETYVFVGWPFKAPTIRAKIN